VDLKQAKPENLKRFWTAMTEEGIAYADLDVDGFLGLEPSDQ
jgi:hypothetical protein